MKTAKVVAMTVAFCAAVLCGASATSVASGAATAAPAKKKCTKKHRHHHRKCARRLPCCVRASKANRGHHHKPPPPPPCCGAIPGTGQILAQDLAPNADALSIWKYINHPAEIQTFTTGGDTHPTIDGSVHSGFRRLPLQASDDTGTGARRLEMGTAYYGTDGSTFWINREGDTNIYYWSVRIDNKPTVNSMVWEMYNREGSPIFHFDHYGNALALVLNHQGDSELNKIWTAPVPTQTWLRFAMAAHYSADPSKGWVQLWGDPVGGAALKQLTGKVTGYATIAPGPYAPPYHSALEAGIYQGLSEPLITLDFANWQVAKFSP